MGCPRTPKPSVSQGANCKAGAVAKAGVVRKSQREVTENVTLSCH